MCAGAETTSNSLLTTAALLSTSLCCQKSMLAHFGEINGKAVCCKHRMTPTMVGVKSKQCRYGEVLLYFEKAKGKDVLQALHDIKNGENE